MGKRKGAGTESGDCGIKPAEQSGAGIYAAKALDAATQITLLSEKGNIFFLSCLPGEGIMRGQGTSPLQVFRAEP